MSRILVLAIVSSLILVITLLSVKASQTDATFPGANGKIAFVQGEINGPRHIWTMNPDGSGRTQLTFGDAGDFHPSWSPDGQKITFIREASSQFTIMVMNGDGSGLASVPNTSGASTPSFFPSNDKLLFDNTGELYSINLDGSNLQNITNNPSINESNAAISPNGLLIAIQTFAQGDTYSDITVRNIDGSNPIVVTASVDADVGSPVWSPDSTQVVFAASGPIAGGSNHEIGVANADGSNTQVFADPTSFDTAPGFSPDGTKLVFQGAPLSITVAGANPYTTGHIFVANTNTSGRQNISGGNSDDYDPDWGVAGTPATPSATPAPTLSPTPVVTASPTATPTPTPSGQLVWGDNNCSGEANPVDSLLTLRYDAGLAVETGECPEFGTNISLVASALAWGDVDCGNTIDPIDSLKLLRFDAGLSVAQADGCPAIGSQVQIEAP